MHDLPANRSQTRRSPSQQTSGSAEGEAVNVILDAFYRNDSPERQAMETASWLRVLRGFDADDILAAWESYQRPERLGGGSEGRKGYKRRPTSENIRSRCAALVAARRPIPQPENPAGYLEQDEREVISSAQADKIMAENGYTMDHAKLVKEFPGVQHREALVDAADKFDASEKDLDRLKAARMATEIGAAALAQAGEQEAGE